VFLFKHVFDCFVEKDCDMIEINPLVVLKDGTVMAADSKITIDDNLSSDKRNSRPKKIRHRTTTRSVSHIHSTLTTSTLAAISVV